MIGNPQRKKYFQFWVVDLECLIHVPREEFRKRKCQILAAKLAGTEHDDLFAV
jgi:hypothetical protein